MELWRKKGSTSTTTRGPSGALEEKSVHVDYNKGPHWSFGGKKRPRRLQKGAPVELLKKKNRPRRLEKGAQVKLWRKKKVHVDYKKGAQWSFGGKKRPP